MKDFDGVITELANLTKINDHTTAYITGCEFLKELGENVDDVIDTLEVIKGEHKRVGYLTSDLSCDRYSAYQEMLTIAKGVLNSVQYQQFYQSF